MKTLIREYFPDNIAKHTGNRSKWIYFCVMNKVKVVTDTGLTPDLFLIVRCTNDLVHYLIPLY